MKILKTLMFLCGTLTVVEAMDDLRGGSGQHPKRRAKGQYAAPHSAPLPEIRGSKNKQHGAIQKEKYKISNENLLNSILAFKWNHESGENKKALRHASKKNRAEPFNQFKIDLREYVKRALKNPEADIVLLNHISEELGSINYSSNFSTIFSYVDQLHTMHMSPQKEESDDDYS